jgi:putative PIN family toxin of toxin-antitoxin system
MRAVLDTNVLVRCTKYASGPARECFTHFESREHTFVISPYLLAELARVLTYPRIMAQHRLSPEEMRAFLAAVEDVGEMVQTPHDSLQAVVSADPDDDPIIQLAIAGHAAVLCTRDRQFHHPDVQAYCAQHGIRILSDLELLRELRALASPPPP